MSVSKLCARGLEPQHAEEMRQAAVPTVVVMLLHIITNVPASSARDATPENWKELPESEKRDFLRRNYGPLATSDVTSPPPSYDEPPVLLPTVATDRRRAPFPVLAREATPESWKDWPEEKKRAYLVRNYGADSVRTDV